MSALKALVDALSSGQVEVVDLTARLSNDTPIIALPPEFGQTQRFELEEISKYNEAGPGWYWNNFKSGEHTGTHFDAPNHWVTGQDKSDVADVPVGELIREVVVLDFSKEVEENPDFLLTVEHVKAWEAENGPLPDGGWAIYRTGWDKHGDTQESFINANETGPHTPGMSVECAKWFAEEAPVIGVGVETVGTDAGQAFAFETPFPCHAYLLGAGKYGLTQLQNVEKLPTRGAVLIAGPLPIVTGSGAPARVYALIEK